MQLLTAVLLATRSKERDDDEGLELPDGDGDL